MNVQKDTYIVFNKQALANAQTALSVNLSAKESISKVLFLGAEAQILNYEVNKGEILLSGRCNYKLLTQNAEGITQGLNYNADFADRIVADILPDTKISLSCSILDNSYTQGDNGISISTLVDTSVTAYVATEIEAVTSAEGVISNSQDYTVSTAQSSHKINTVLVQELQFEESVARVLLTESNAVVSSFAIAENVLTVSGNGTVNIVCADTEGKLFTQKAGFDFTQEIPVKDMDSAVLTCARVTATKIHIDIVEESVNNLLTAEISLEITLYENQTREITLLTDAYSTTHNLQLYYGDVTTSLPLGTSSFNTEITETISTTCDAVIGVVGEKTEITKITAYDGSIEIEGLLTFTALLTNNGEVSGSYYELPFFRTFQADVTANSSVSACCTVDNSSCKCERQNIKYNANLTVTANATENETIQYLTDIDEGERFAEPPAFEICIARKGEGLWETAKNLNMEQNDIVQTNPDLTFPLDKDTQIVVYHRI